MQMGKCPSCNAPIGGQNHENVHGVRDAKQNVAAMALFGFDCGYQYIDNEHVHHLDGATTYFLRILVNIAISIASHLKPCEQGVKELMKMDNMEDIRNRLNKGNSNYLQQLTTAASADCTIIAALIQAAIYMFTLKDSPFWGSHSNCSEVEDSKRIESVTSEIMRPLSFDVYSEIRNRINKSWQTAQIEKSVANSLGEHIWSGINVCSDSLWQFRPAVTFAHFIAAVSKDTLFEARYSLLHSFLLQEDRLSHVQGIVAILEWHRVLLTVFQNNEMSREEASNITNEDAVRRLPSAEEQAKASQILDNFCEVFNRSFPLVENLYECQPNPFLTDKREVDLSGSGTPTPMTRNTTVLFSIPSMNQGENVAAGLCTIQLLLQLHRIHEHALGMGAAAAARRQRRQPQEPAPVQGQDDSIVLPEISCETSPDILRSSLVDYDRSAHFLPLLHTSATYNPKDNSISFDFAQLQAGVHAVLVEGRQSVRLNIAHYQYRGGLRTNGALSRLRQRVPQESINPSILQLIFAEMDTQNRVTTLLSRLEMVISFLATVGGEGVRGMNISDLLLRLAFFFYEKGQCIALLFRDFLSSITFLTFFFQRILSKYTANHRGVGHPHHQRPHSPVPFAGIVFAIGREDERQSPG